MKVNTQSTVAQNEPNQQLDKYKALVEKLVQLGADDWQNFQEDLKKTFSISKL